MLDMHARVSAAIVNPIPAAIGASETIPRDIGGYVTRIRSGIGVGRPRVGGVLAVVTKPVEAEDWWPVSAGIETLIWWSMVVSAVEV